MHSTFPDIEYLFTDSLAIDLVQITRYVVLAVGRIGSDSSSMITVFY